MLFDEQIFLLQEYGGISRYFTELIKAFKSTPSLGIDPIISSHSVRNQYLLKEIDFLPLKPVSSLFVALCHLVFQVVFKRKLSQAVDLVHLTFYLPLFFSRYRGLPKAVTIHDMTPEKAQLPVRFCNPHYSKRSHSRSANLLFSVSKSTTDDMERVYNSKFKVVTTYLGVGPEYQPGLPKSHWQPNKYFLFVGNRIGYKDFTIALEAFVKISSKYPDLLLILVGGGTLNTTEEKLIDNVGISSRVIQKNALPEELPNIYSNALALVYPTKYEGFGLPLVESMASGTPILASRTPINEEIAGDCASFFPVGDSKALSELMDKLCTDFGSFQGNIDRGLIRAKNFTWEKCAELTAAAYRSLVEAQKVKS